MRIKDLNRRQVRWAMKLLAYDFTILHRSSKINFVDASFKRSDYRVENESINRLLFTL